jgi:N-acyl homoserine lactone hydrolase
MIVSRVFGSLASLLVLLAAATGAQAQPTGRDSQSLRLYVLEGGVLASDPTRYHMTSDQVQSTALSVAAYLIVHPKGVLLWDAGAVPDDERASKPAGAEQHLTLADGQGRDVTLGPTLLGQIEACGYSPADVTYLVLSHYHWDHTANANAFASATWLARKVEHDAMFAPNATGSIRPATYAALANAGTQYITADEYDVFGDGKVIIKFAPGHTPGHQVLYVDLEHTGPIVLSGDLYHYPEERALGKLPTFEFDAEQTKASRKEVESFLKRKHATLWIQHDLVAHRKLKKAPEYYD